MVLPIIGGVLGGAGLLMSFAGSRDAARAADSSVDAIYKAARMDIAMLNMQTERADVLTTREFNRQESAIVAHSAGSGVSASSASVARAMQINQQQKTEELLTIETNRQMREMQIQAQADADAAAARAAASAERTRGAGGLLSGLGGIIGAFG